MAALSVANALVAIRTSTNHDADTQVTDTQLTAKLDQEYKRLHRVLGQLVPSLFEVVSLPTITSTATPYFAKPSNTERIRKVERLGSGGRYYPLAYGQPLGYRDPSVLTWYEQAGNILITPDTSAIGSYRLTLITGVVSGYTSLDLIPEGCETIIIERCAAFLRQRHREAFQHHLDLAEAIWKEQKPAMMKRSGAHPVPGLVIVC